MTNVQTASLLLSVLMMIICPDQAIPGKMHLVPHYWKRYIKNCCVFLELRHLMHVYISQHIFRMLDNIIHTVTGMMILMESVLNIDLYHIVLIIHMITHICLNYDISTILWVNVTIFIPTIDCCS